MNSVLLGNIISLFGACILVALGFIKRRDKILFVQCIQIGVMGVANYVIGGVTGAVSNVLAILRNVFCLKRELTLLSGFAFTAAQALLTIFLNDKGFLGWLPFFSNLIYNLMINTKDEIKLKLSIILSVLCWVVYDFALQNYVSFVFNILSIGSNLCGIFMLQKAQKEQ